MTEAETVCELSVSNQAEVGTTEGKVAEVQESTETCIGGQGVPPPALLQIPTPSRGARSAAVGSEKGGKRSASALEEIMRRKGVDEAWNVFEEMHLRGEYTDKYTVSRMLMKTVGDGRSRLNPSRIYRVISIVEKFIEVQPHDVDEVLLNALLDTCCRLKDLTRLESIMQRMRDLKITPSPVTLGILVKTYGQAGNIEKVLQVWDDMEKQRGQANAVTYGCMIDACVKCNRLDKAKEIFKGMRETGKHRNTIIYTTMIKGFGLEKDLPRALELFREMPYEGVPRNTITYNSIMDACVKGGDLVTAESLLHEITVPNSPLEPDLITFSTLLKGYCHIGDLDNALRITEAIKSRGLRCDELVYNTLMDGCVKANDVAAGVGLFEEMVHMGMRPSAITHSILARLYQKAGYEEDAADAVVQLYQHHGIEKPAWGDRSKGRLPKYQRSPLGRNGVSPAGSPIGGYGHYERSDGCWDTWSDARSVSIYDGYSAAQSCSSTPCGSPHHTVSTGSNGLFLPIDAMKGVPPLPGMGSDTTPYGTPMSGGFVNTFPGPPQMSPAGSPAHAHSYSNAPSFATVPQAVPPFPFAGSATSPVFTGAGFASQRSNGADAQVPQFFQTQMAQPASAVVSATMAPTAPMLLGPGPQWPMNNTPNTEGMVYATPASQQFPLAGPAPHDNMPAHFENITLDGQMGNAPPPNGAHQNPFCL
jgi:pentatricopeptide repeat protein